MVEYPIASPQVIKRAREVLELSPIFLDTETTGTGPGDLIIEVGIVDVNGDVLYEGLINPDRPIPMESSAVNGITNEDVKDEPRWPEVWPVIELILKDRAIGIYNADFDMRLLRQSCEAYNLPWTIEMDQSFCMMKLFAAYYGEWNPRYNGFKSHKLEFAGKLLELAEQNTHHAVDDAKLTAELLRKIAAQPLRGKQ
ncbi:MAG TPA: 3'-5' exonuclease [Anaerolineaceae bacterium]|nr:3'-5' exonuclease [Chloroflexota bacterium]HNY83690.1 3'-5' exonuclease [Anaerolineaceae bacterium]